jgi:hypothetical protein
VRVMPCEGGMEKDKPRQCGQTSGRRGALPVIVPQARDPDNPPLPEISGERGQTEFETNGYATGTSRL